MSVYYFAFLLFMVLGLRFSCVGTFLSLSTPLYPSIVVVSPSYFHLGVMCFCFLSVVLFSLFPIYFSLRLITAIARRSLLLSIVFTYFGFCVYCSYFAVVSVLSYLHQLSWETHQ